MPLDKRQSTRRPLINVPASAPTHSPSAYSSRRRNTAHLPTWRRLFRLTVLKRYAVSLSFLAGFLVCWGLVWSSSAVSWRGSQGQERLAGFEGKPSAGDLLRGEQGSELFRSSTGILASIAAQPPLPPPSITPSFTSAPLHTDDPIHDFQPSTHLGVDHSSALRPADDSNGVIPLDGSSSSSSSTNNDSPDMTPIFIDTRASSIPSTQPSSNEVFLSYLPHSGYHNGRVSLANALLLSRALNATLLLPPAFLSSKPIAFRSIPVLRSKLVKTIAARTNDAATCAAGGHRRMSARANGQGREGDEDMIVGGLTKDGSDAVQVSGGVRGKKAAAAAAAVDKARGRPGHRKAAGVVGGSPKKHARRCEGWNSTTLVSWEWLVDLESLRQEGFRWTEWWDLKDESLGRAPIGLDVLGRDSVQMWGENADRYDRQIILGEVGDEDLSLLSSGVYTAQSTLEDLRKESQGKRHLRFGSLFGTERLIVAPSSSLTATSTSSNDSDDQSSEDWTRLKLVVQRAMAVELSDGGTLSAVVMAERERLNGGMDVYRPDKTGSGDLEGGKEGTGGPSGYIGLHCRLDERSVQTWMFFTDIIVRILMAMSDFAPLTFSRLTSLFLLVMQSFLFYLWSDHPTPVLCHLDDSLLALANRRRRSRTLPLGDICQLASSRPRRRRCRRRYCIPASSIPFLQHRQLIAIIQATASYFFIHVCFFFFHDRSRISTTPRLSTTSVHDSNAPSSAQYPVVHRHRFQTVPSCPRDLLLVLSLPLLSQRSHTSFTSSPSLEKWIFVFLLLSLRLFFIFIQDRPTETST